MTEKVQDILKKIGECYENLAEHFEKMENDSMQSERVAQIARYLSDWEGERASVLSSHLEESDYHDVLKTWLKERPSIPNDLDVADERFACCRQLNNEIHTEDSLMTVISDTHNFIADTYRKLATIVSSEKLRELFTVLGEDEEREVKRAVRNIQEFEYI